MNVVSRDDFPSLSFNASSSQTYKLKTQGFSRCRTSSPETILFTKNKFWKRLSFAWTVPRGVVRFYCFDLADSRSDLRLTKQGTRQLPRSDAIAEALLPTLTTCDRQRNVIGVII